jgi:hypothetical protein
MGAASGAVVVLVEVAGVLGVAVPVVEIVHVVTVLDGVVPATLAVDVLVFGWVVMLVIGGGAHVTVPSHLPVSTTPFGHAPER